MRDGQLGDVADAILANFHGPDDKHSSWWIDPVAAARAALAAAHPTISTVAELEALEVGVVVKSSAGTIACKYDGNHGVVFGDDRPFLWKALALPCTILHWGDQ